MTTIRSNGIQDSGRATTSNIFTLLYKIIMMVYQYGRECNSSEKL